jgi:hypothetical protein
MGRKLVLLNLSFALAATAAINVPLTVRETIYPGSTPGISRTNEPVTVGIPLADSAGVSSTSVLGLTGATAAQFMVEGKWPSGNIKWIKVRAIVPSVSGGGTATVTLTDSGTGNFGGSNLATDNGSTITVSTGAGTFTIKKANFNVVDQVVIGSNTLVAGGSQGLVILGPDPTAVYPGNVTCLPTSGGTPCTTAFASANDPNSTAIIEENGPAMAVIKATGTHLDGAGHSYLHFTARLYFFRNKTYFKVTSILRNADYGTSNTAATAYKGFQGYELRLAGKLTGTLSYSIANDTATPTTGTLNAAGGTDSAYLYQAESALMKSSSWCSGTGCVPYTTLSGYSIIKNGSAALTGTASQYPQGWADISDASGAGIQIGQYQLAAYGNKSLEFNGGGNDIRIGLWARQNNTTGTASTTANQPYYMPWPQWSINDAYVNFHGASTLASATDFLKMQHYLVASAAPSYYNSCNVFTYPLLDPAEEDTYYTSVVSSANPVVAAPSIKDLGVTDTYNWPLTAWRFYAWASGGISNQMEFRMSRVYNFIRRGFTGGYLDSAHFYKFVAEQAFPMSDGFDWRSVSPSETQYVGFPVAASANKSLGMHDWVEPDHEHSHWYGMPEYYFLSGDETIHDGVIEGPKDSFMNGSSAGNGSTSEVAAGSFWNARAVGVYLMSSARLASFLQATGDPDYTTILANGKTVYNLQIKPDFCAYSGYPAGCTVDPYNNISGYTTRQRGVSRVRGVPYQWGDTIKLAGCPSYPGDIRDQAPFMVGIMLEGLWEFRLAMGPSWADYNQAFDLGYGVTQWAFGEMYADNGTSSWAGNGFRYKQGIDFANSCNVGSGGSGSDYYWMVQNPNAFWPIFYFKAMYEGGATTPVWKRQFNQELQQVIAGGSAIKDELYMHTTGQVIYAVNHPTGTSLNTVPISNLQDNGGGTYTITWAVPAGAIGYRIKWAPKRIVDWIGFNTGTYTFNGDPTTTMNWFGATDAVNIPAPSGSTQSLTITTGVTGLTASNFMIKAYAPSTGGSTDTIPPTVSMTAPVGGATVSGTITISATASDNVGVASVQFKLDGANLGNPILGAGPYALSWDSTSISNGSHVLSAAAFDAAGNGSSSGSVTVSVSNATGGSPDYTVSVAPGTVSVAAGNSGTATVTIAAINGFTGAVSLHMGALPTGVTRVFNPDPVNGSGTSIVTLTTTSATPVGTYPITIAANTSTISHTVSMVLTVTGAVSTGPVISAVTAGSISSSAATITWSTDTQSDSQVSYGPTTSYGLNSPLGATMVTTHSVTLTGLSASTTYHFAVMSRDASGTLSTSSDFTFVTSGGSVGPAISAVTAGSITSSAATITWSTDTQSDGQVSYGPTTSYGLTSPLVASMVASHSITLTGLSASTTYHFLVMSRNASGILSTSSDFTFATSGSGGGGTAVPLNTWVPISAHGVPAQVFGYDKSVYVSSRNIQCVWGGYHQSFSSEPNNGTVCYSYSENRWFVLENNGMWHSDHAPSSGHSTSLWAYMPDRDTIVGATDGSGSNVPEKFLGHFWWFDIAGLSGQDRVFTPKPWLGATTPASAMTYDSFNAKLVLFPDLNGVAEICDPATNSCSAPQVTGTAPPAVGNLSLVYNSADHKVYMFGGGQSDIYTFDAAAKVWTKLTPTCTGADCVSGKPPTRMAAGFAYSTADNVFLMAGGVTSFGGQAFSDTWLFDPVANAWREQSPIGRYSNDAVNTTFDRVTYDADSNVFLLIASGGSNPYADGTYGAYVAQVWAYAYTPALNYGRKATTFVPPAGSLNRVAPAALTQSWAFDPAITSSGSVIYNGWIESGTPFDTSNCGLHHPYIQSGSSITAWTGLPGGSQSTACTSIDPEPSTSPGGTDASKLRLTVVNGTLWEAHEKWNNSNISSSAWAKSWNGNSWTGGAVGCFSGTCSTQLTQHPEALLANGLTPTLAAVEENHNVFVPEAYLYVAQWNGTAWAPLGGKLNVNTTGSRVMSATLASNGTNPAACWSEEVSSSRSVVSTTAQIQCSQWNGSSWTRFGASSLNRNATSWAYSPSMTYLGGQFYVGWEERTTSGVNKLYVCRWDGSTCTLLGGAALNISATTGWAVHPSLANDGTNLYVAWEEQSALGQKSIGYVKKWNGTSWSQIGSALNADPIGGSVAGISLAIVQGAPTATWTELTYGNLSQVYTKQWNGTTWTGASGNSGPPPISCDLNGDGKVDGTDVTLATNQALGIQPCTTADLQGIGQCTVVGVQRIIAASLGGACKIGN